MKLTDRIRRWWNPPESQKEIAAEKRLDEVTRGVAWEEFDKNEGTSPLGPLVHPAPHGEDSDPTDERGLRDALRDGEKEYEENERKN
jgi:hypothetical protein